MSAPMSMRRRVRSIALGGAVAALAFGTAGAQQPAAIVIPLYVEHSPYRVPHLGIDVAIGSIIKRLEVDTSSPGLRILASALPPAAVERTANTVTGDYGNGLDLRGVQANAQLTIGGLHSERATPLELVESIACASWAPKCPAAKGGVPDDFGRVFPGVLGLMMTNAMPADCCVNPLLGLERRAGHSYILHAAFLKPTLTLNPDSTLAGTFVTVPVGMSSWPSGCIAVKDVQLQVCGDVVIDTGLQETVIQDPAPSFQGIFPGGTIANLSIGAWKHDFTSGGERDERYSMFSQRGDKKRIILGLGALQDFDILFDADRTRIGFAAR